MSLQTTVIENTRPTKPCQIFEGQTRRVRDVIHLPGGQQIMTCSEDSSLGVWNLQTGKHIANWQDGGSAVYSIALSVDGKKVVSGSYDGAVRLWSIETGKVIAKWTGHTLYVWSLCWNRDGERVLSGSWDRTARVWDVETGNTILEINTGLNNVFTATFSPYSTLIATGGDSSQGEFIKIWDANTGKLVTILKGHTWDVECLAWTADGRTLISGSGDFTIRIWNTSTWQQRAVFTGHSGTVQGIAISPNGCILASASRDDKAQLWNLDNGQPIGSPLQHPGWVRCVSFSTDGKLLATGCEDKNAYIWDVSAIIKEAGLNELLDDEKSFLNADATRRPAQKPKNVRTIPTNFFAELSSHPDPNIAPPISPSVILESASPMPLPAVPEDTPPEAQPNPPERSPSRLFKWLRLSTPARQTFLQRATLPFFKQRRRQDEEGIELKERPSSIVDVPLAPGLPADIVPPVSLPVVAESGCPIPLPAVPEDTPPEAQSNSPERAPPRSPKWLRLNTRARPAFLQRAKLPFFKQPRRQDKAGIQLKERQEVKVVDVPLAPGRFRIATEEEKKKPKDRAEDETQQASIANKSKNMKNVATTSQSPTQSNVIQQSAGQSHAQQSSEPHPAAFNPSATSDIPTPSPATVLAPPAPATITIQAGCWSRFLLCIGCVSVRHASGHH